MVFNKEITNLDAYLFESRFAYLSLDLLIGVQAFPLDSRLSQTCRIFKSQHLQGTNWDIHYFGKYIETLYNLFGRKYCVCNI